jgi:thioesterase domain-containing protein
MSPVKWPLRTWLAIACGRIARLVTNRSTPARTQSTEHSPPATMIRVAAGALFASARYRPRHYRGRLTLFTPVEREPGLPSLEVLWRKHADAVTVIETPGSHATMLAAPNAETTAALLSRSLPHL